MYGDRVCFYILIACQDGATGAERDRTRPSRRLQGDDRVEEGQAEEARLHTSVSTEATRHTETEEARR